MLDLNNMPNFTARIPKTPHDLTQSLSFTCSTGMELPVFKDLLLPGDEIPVEQVKDKDCVKS